MKPYNPVKARNIPLELAQIQRERGYALTRSEFKALGYTDDQLSESNILKAAEIYAQLCNERVAA
ncbi:MULTISPECIES: hypothetical protein [unclassified Rhizobium]|uniref:hypothetical protein n=1 Tax=unclassified Rhizobium TaxID=2613769 RepID=UPI001AE9E9E8|nr:MULTISPECIES: hypothetical protein [unclassified Rhizobium]MBP2459612.1 hypothetical protein [Rhizobium sp. PvP014]MBP2531906.1 hypothetical protein [Rhizobium sp. PvP099]